MFGTQLGNNCYLQVTYQQVSTWVGKKCEILVYIYPNISNFGDTWFSSSVIDCFPAIQGHASSTKDGKVGNVEASMYNVKADVTSSLEYNYISS